MLFSGPLDRCRSRRVAAPGTQVSWSLASCAECWHKVRAMARSLQTFAAYTPSSASSGYLLRSIMIFMRIR
jgi:hypothetical protein